jgi:hypothetical protein
MRRAGHVAHIVNRRNVYKALIKKPERKKPLGKPRRRWDENIKIHLQERGCVA